MKTTRDYTIESVKKALGILKLFDDQNTEMTLSEISQVSGIGKSSMLRFLQTMLNEGFISYDEGSRKYSLGIELYRLGQFKYNSLDVCRIASRYLQVLSNETNLICYLGVRQGDLMVMLHQYLPAHIPAWMQLTVQGGGTRPLYSTGIGRLFLAQESDESVQAYLNRTDIRKLTDSTITDKEVLMELIRRARKDRYASNKGENESRVCSLCVPVYDLRGEMVAGISLCGLEEDILPGGTYHQEHLHKTLIVAEQISRELGYLKK